MRPILSMLLLGFAAAPALSRARPADEDLPRLAIEMKAAALREFEKTRDRLFYQGALGESVEAGFSVSLLLEGRTEARERDTWAGKISLVTLPPEKPPRADGWPLRVELKTDQYLFGMRGFTLRPAKTGSSLSEALVLDQLQREDVLVARTLFVRVSLRGRDMGLMLLEESYSKGLLESQQRREGVILGFEAPHRPAMEATAGQSPSERDFYRVRLLPYQATVIAENEALSESLATATGLMRGFLQDLLPAQDVFDLDSMSGFLAVVELWGARRALEWPNLRFYFNPVTQRLEPIACEVRPELQGSGLELVTQEAAWASLLLEDPEIHSAFQRRLKKLAADLARGDEASRLERVQASLLRSIRSRDPAHALPVDLSPVVNRAASLAELAQRAGGGEKPRGKEPSRAATGTSPATAEGATTPAFEVDPSRALRVYRGREEGREYLEFANLLPTRMELLSIALTGLDPWQRTDFALRAPSRLPVVLPPPAASGRPHFVQMLFHPPRVEPPKYGFEVVIAVDGRQQRGPIEVLPYFPARRSNPIPKASLSQTLARHPFLEWDEPGRILRARAGTWKLAGSLILPPGVGLELAPATTLQFPAEGLLLASGPLRFRGTAQQPVVFEGQPGGRGGTGRWQGIAVLESDRSHLWEHVVVRDTEDARRDGWRLTGGVTIRASELRFANTRFQGHRGEDALNLIRSRFELDEVSIFDTPSDAFDCDFCSGRVTGGRFAGIGGDAIDVSGSEVLLEGVRFEDVRDKAVSVGEGSQLTARRLEIRGAGTALASKDDSLARLEDSSLARITHAALMAYVKKPEYGPAQVIALDVRMQEVGRAAIAQRGSRISIDGVEQEPEDVDIDALYRRGYMKK